jgi:hypothetical protein
LNSRKGSADEWWSETHENESTFKRFLLLFGFVTFQRVMSASNHFFSLTDRRLSGRVDAAKGKRIAPFPVFRKEIRYRQETRSRQQNL